MRKKENLHLILALYSIKYESRGMPAERERAIVRAREQQVGEGGGESTYTPVPHVLVGAYTYCGSSVECGQWASTELYYYICTVHSPTPAPSYSVWVLFKPVDILVPVEAVRHISEQFLPAR